VSSSPPLRRAGASKTHDYFRMISQRPIPVNILAEKSLFSQALPISGLGKFIRIKHPLFCPAWAKQGMLFVKEDAAGGPLRQARGKLPAACRAVYPDPDITA